MEWKAITTFYKKARQKENYHKKKQTPGIKCDEEQILLATYTTRKQQSIINYELKPQASRGGNKFEHGTFIRW